MTFYKKLYRSCRKYVKPLAPALLLYTNCKQNIKFQKWLDKKGKMRYNKTKGFKKEIISCAQ